MHDRGNRCGLALGRWQVDWGVAIAERYREKVGEKIPCRASEIICRAKQYFQLLQLGHRGILKRKTGGSLELTDHRMKRAVSVIGRALADQIEIVIVSDPLAQDINDP